MSTVEQKTNAAAAALEYVEDGMTLGLGSGSTAEIFVRLLGARIEEEGLKVQGLPTSKETEALAREVGVPLMPVEHAVTIDVTVDGADEVDGRFHLIKGGGGCLLREKIIAAASDRMVVICDETKLVETLGRFPLPVEVDPFAFTITAKKVFDALRRAGVKRPDVNLRRRGDGLEPFVTDGGHYILDCACGEIPEPELADAELIDLPGVIEHGLFLDLARVVIVGEDEAARVMEL
ncbi:ribose 5-phosphate isomerase A [Marinicauda salina]|uniref:Ribose-5-phosphate isomerase A n=1 Tax=Marinicauda salina TaxID=2135793 RepID=A0A2U2BSW0_9PROT|nr:ribose-5-phosphate isomerase RpiA [Marinicauda salina]PWE17092.1 ribose 5-phosphate isomerase A [Marinicauda salina]